MPSFLFENGTFFPTAGPKVVASPASGSTQIMAKGQTQLVITAGATIAAQTVKLPPSPLTGMVVSITSTVAITVLGVQTAAGVALAGSPFAAVAATPLIFQYLAGAWVKLVGAPAGPATAETTVTVTGPSGSVSHPALAPA